MEWQLEESGSLEESRPDKIHFEAEYHTSTDGLGNWHRGYNVV